ncbi:MAG: SBBP repeat-containing protein, partial [candidate division WOR-3 bacterium]
DYATIKYDSAGTQQWVSRYSGPAHLDDYARAIAIDSAGSVCVTGGSTGVGTRQDITTVKYDSAGVEQWVARYDGPSSVSDEGAGIAIDHEGNIYVTGPSDGTDATDYATVKYDSAGVEQWVARYDGPNNYDDYSFAIAVHNGGSVYVTGRSEGVGTDQDYATIKYSPTGILENELTLKNGHEITATIFRGPLQLPDGKNCRVFDITGRVVESDKIQPGIYFVEIDDEIVQKVIKIR